MKEKKMTMKIIVLLVILAFGSLVIGCNKSTEDEMDSETQVNQEDSQFDENQEEDELVEENDEIDDEDEKEEEIVNYVSPLSGLEVSSEEVANRRPIGIMISNIHTALPQYGISQADVIYETLVEGGITRLFALFQDFDAEKIGPIRSARHYYLEFALDNDAIYTHVGQSTYAKEAFKTLDVDRFYGISQWDDVFTFQDPDRSRPHSTFTSYDGLMDLWDQMGYRKEHTEDYSPEFSFNDSVKAEGTDANVLILDYSGAYDTNPTFTYNADDGVYYRSEFGEAQMDAATNTQLSFTNIIVQYTDIWRIASDPLGCMDMTLVGDGEGMYLSQGKMIPITWTKSDDYSPTSYFTEDGQALTLNKGKTFISVYPNNRIDNITVEE